MQELSLNQAEEVVGGDRWCAESSSETITGGQAEALANCVGGASGHDGASAAACLFLILDLM